MQCGPHHRESLLRSPGAAWLLAAAVPRVANPARTKEEAPLGSLELGEICPNCIFGDVSRNAQNSQQIQRDSSLASRRHSPKVLRTNP